MSVVDQGEHRTIVLAPALASVVALGERRLRAEFPGREGVVVQGAVFVDAADMEVHHAIDIAAALQPDALAATARDLLRDSRVRAMPVP